MGNEPAWHARAVEHLSHFFDKEPDASAFVLTGSLAATDVQEDVWSDVDANIILAHHSIERYYRSTAWLAPLGRLVGVERHENHVTKTLRVCLENLQRFDLAFIAEPALQNPSLWHRNPFHLSYVVVWSRLPDLETRIAALPPPTEYQDLPEREIDRIVDESWFKAALAIARVVRNDLLIGLHLALDVARAGLTLQMTRRDQEKRTTIHRIGGWSNELAARFSWSDQAGSGEGILDLIRLSCEVLDELASELLPAYQPRGPVLFPSIESARQICRTRT